MKCMKLGDSIKRVSEKEVSSLLRQGYNYCSKSEWKEKVRVLVPKKETETVKSAEKKKGKQNPKGKAKKSY